MVRILNRRFNQFQTQCNISQLEKYYNLENNENEIRNYSVEKINDNDLLLHCSYKYTPKDKNKYMIYELPLHINQKIQSYLYIFIKLTFKINHPDRFPFDPPIWSLEKINHNIPYLNLKEYYNSIVININNEYNKLEGWTPGIVFEKYVLLMIMRINNFEILHNNV